MSQLRAHLLTAGLEPSAAGRIEKLILMWIKSSGAEWTVDRLKSLKQWYIHRINGENHYVPAQWISIRDGRVAGPLGAIFTLKKPRKVLDALMVYTGLKLVRPSQRQIRKFFSSVEAPPVRIGLVPFLCSTVEDFIASSGIEYSDEPDSWQRYPFSGRKFLPSADSSKSIPNRIIALCDDFRSESVHEALQNCSLEFEISHALGRLYPGLLELTDHEPVPNSHYVGKIGCIQERGCKGRFIANPKLTYQLATRNLALYLQKIQRALPSDCTFLQEEGVVWAQGQLRLGRTLHSVDLSDASNHVPYRLTRHVLRWLQVPARVIEVMDWVSTGEYRWKHGARHSLSTRWTKGQPLGTYPSFPAFSLTLGFVLLSCEKMVGVRDTFRTLGDDVIISDSRVAKRFTDFLDHYHMPVSMDKSIVGKVGEFASYLITRDVKFRPRKIVQPNENNLLYRLGLTIKDAGDAKTPLELLAVGERILSGENSSGLSLRRRASLALALGLISEERSEPFTRSEQTGLCGELKYALMERLITIGNREWILEGNEERSQDISQYLSTLDEMSASNLFLRKDEPLLVSLLKLVGVRDENLDDFQTLLIEDWIPKLFVRSYKDIPMTTAKKIARAQRAQTKILGQSAAVVESRILEAMYDLLVRESESDLARRLVR